MLKRRFSSFCTFISMFCIFNLIFFVFFAQSAFRSVDARHYELSELIANSDETFSKVDADEVSLVRIKDVNKPDGTDEKYLDDIAEILCGFEDSGLQKFIGENAKSFEDKDEALKYIKTTSRESDDYLGEVYYAVLAEDKVVGLMKAAIYKIPDQVPFIKKRGVAVLSGFIDKDEQNKGYGYKAAKCLVGLVGSATDLCILNGNCFGNNPEALRLVAKISKDFLGDGEFSNMNMTQNGIVFKIPKGKNLTSAKKVDGDFMESNFGDSDKMKDEEENKWADSFFVFLPNNSAIVNKVLDGLSQNDTLITKVAEDVISNDGQPNMSNIFKDSVGSFMSSSPLVSLFGGFSSNNLSGDNSSLKDLINGKDNDKKDNDKDDDGKNEDEGNEEKSEEQPNKQDVNDEDSDNNDNDNDDGNGEENEETSEEENDTDDENEDNDE